MHVTTISEKRSHEFEGSRRGTWEDLGGGKGRENDAILL